MRSATRRVRTCAHCRSRARRCCGRWPRHGRRRRRVELLQPSSLEELDGASNSLLLAGGTDLVPLLREGLVAAETLIDVRGVVPRGIREGGTVVGAGTTLA